MSTTIVAPETKSEELSSSIETQVNVFIDEMIAELPNPETLSAEQRRGMIARYSSVLEANFIYWMTASAMAVKSEEVREILFENLHEEVHDAHPVMLRKFAVAAGAYPNASDALATDKELTAMRRFLGKLQGAQSLITMAFFEGWIQRFMGYLGDLAVRQGSSELEYTDVHGVCDVTHTAELFRAFSIQLEESPLAPGADLFEGIKLLSTLIRAIVKGPAPVAA